MFVMTKAINEMTIKRLEELQSPAELTSFDGLLLFYAFVGRIFAVSGGRFHVSSCRRKRLAKGSGRKAWLSM